MGLRILLSNLHVNTFWTLCIILKAMAHPAGVGGQLQDVARAVPAQWCPCASRAHAEQQLPGQCLVPAGIASSLYAPSLLYSHYLMIVEALPFRSGCLFDMLNAELFHDPSLFLQSQLSQEPQAFPSKVAADAPNESPPPQSTAPLPPLPPAAQVAAAATVAAPATPAATVPPTASAAAGLYLSLWIAIVGLHTYRQQTAQLRRCNYLRQQSAY